MNVAYYVPCFEFHLFLLHEVTPKGSATMHSAGVHLMGGRLTYARGVSGSYVRTTRVKPDWFIAAAVLSPVQKIDINDLHVALAHSHWVTLRVTAHQLGVKVSGEQVPCAGCSEAKRTRMAVPWSTDCRSTKPL